MKKSIFFILVAIFLSGCASVPMAPLDQSNYAKEFKKPSQGKAGLYIYRDSTFGAALKKTIWINEECIGKTAAKVFFYKEVDGNKEYTITTESEFSPNEITIKVKDGFNYFVRQYIKMGAFVGGADLELVDEEKGKKAVSKLKMAQSGTCDK